MLLDGRYRCFRLIKSGHGIETYLAEDLQGGGDQVIVKLLRTEEVAPEVRVRLEHEAAVLTRLGTPTFKPLVAYGQDDGRLFLVQPFLPGKNLAELLALSGGPLSVTNTLVIAAHLLSELSRAHEEGVLHRDVKPANILVQGDDPVERATLVDFGLSLSSSLPADFKNQAVGTARYLSPEEAGLVDAVIDGRSDIYSLGAVLYECLTGHPLFEGTTVGEVLRQHLSLQVPRLRAAGLPVPRALEGVLLRMLGKEPGQRYQSAQGALADVEEIIAGLNRGVSEPPVMIGLHDRRSVLTEPAFVGRTSELATLNEHLNRARAGRGALFYLAAESGGGKTRLLEEFAGQASSSGAWILNGQGVDQAAQHPYQLLEGVAKDINSAIQSDEQLLERLLHRLGDRAEAVAVTLPELGAFVSHAGIDKLPEAYGEVRSLTALSSLLGSLGTPETPAVVLLDDCQWTDGLTAKLLDRWLSQTDEEPTYVLVVAAFRSEEVGPNHPIRRISPTARLDLQPLTTSELHDMVQSMAGRLPDEVMDTVATLSEGSPFMAAAVLMGLVETGALFESAGRWKVDDAALAAAQTSRRAAIFLVRRLELLPEEALRLLSIGAVLGKEFDLDLAISLTGQSHDDALKALAEARSRKIVWLDESGGRCHFLHDKIREALLGKLDGEERTELHRRAALQIEELDSSRVFELAYHFDAAGEAERALPFAVAAAEHARSQHTLEIAEAHYRMADRSAANAGLATRRRVAEGLGDVLTLRGSYEEAVEQFKRSLGMTEDRQSRAALQGKLGDVAFRYGDMVGARDALEGALKQLNFRMPRTFLGLMLALFWEAVIQALHSALPKLFIGRRSLDNTERQLLAVRLYSRLAYVYWFHSGKLRCGWAHLREMNLAERYPPTLELAQAYSEHAPVMTMVPWFSRGLEYAKRSHKIRTELGDVWGQGQSLNFEGVTLYAASRFEEAIERCLEAKRLLERTGDRWEVNTAGWNIAFAQYRLGRRAEAIKAAKGVHAAATEIGDQAAAGIALSGWSRASEGDVPSELIKAQLDRSGDEDASTTVEVHLAEGVRLLRTGEIDRAVSVLQAARALIRKAGLRQEYVAPVLPWLATALRIQMEQFAANSAVPRRTLLRNILVTRRAVRLSRSYRNNLPHALREQGLIAALDRRPRTSRRKLIASLKAANAQGARLEEAKTLEAIARIGEKLGWAEASESKRAAEALMLQIQAPGPADQPDRDTLSLADRFAALMEAGRSIASASDREGVYQSVQKAAKTLLRGEHCFVLDLHGHGSEAAENALHGQESLSFTIVERALELGAPVVSNFADSVDATESLVLSGVRSVMCVPISSEEGALALLYVTHGLVSGLFGEEEIQLASYISTLAGAALDHVAGSEARFRSLAQNSSDVITIVDPGGQITYQSSSLQPIFGFQPLEMIGSRLDRWVHPADVQQVNQSINFSDSAGGGNALLECRLRASDGSWRYTETAISNLVDDPSVRGV
ncbi:MAG: AAA family ATPase, partial [Actinomycetota bacterium]